NIIVDQSGEPHITDFGLAKWTHDTRDLTMEGELLGTISYMAPEQARGQAARVDRRADVYALGVLLYEMLTRKVPFRGEAAEVIQAILFVEPVAPSSAVPRVPRDLETICLKALEKDPSSRYSTAQEMAVDLRRFLRRDPIVARRVNPVQRS